MKFVVLIAALFALNAKSATPCTSSDPRFGCKAVIDFGSRVLVQDPYILADGAPFGIRFTSDVSLYSVTAKLCEIFGYRDNYTFSWTKSNSDVVVLDENLEFVSLIEKSSDLATLGSLNCVR